MKALFDTNILIDDLSGNERADAELGRYSHRLISAVTWMEVLVGARTDEEEAVIELFLRAFQVVVISRMIARAAVEIRQVDRLACRMRSSGRARGMKRRCW